MKKNMSKKVRNGFCGIDIFLTFVIPRAFTTGHFKYERL